jgi:hypothetical protein
MTKTSYGFTERMVKLRFEDVVVPRSDVPKFQGGALLMPRMSIEQESSLTMYSGKKTHPSCLAGNALMAMTTMRRRRREEEEEEKKKKKREAIMIK